MQGQETTKKNARKKMHEFTWLDNNDLKKKKRVIAIIILKSMQQRNDKDKEEIDCKENNHRFNSYYWA